MDFELDEEQQMLRASAREFLRAECDKAVLRELEESDSGHSASLWTKMAELGWAGIAVPEEYGGAGWGLLGLAVLFEEIGRAAFDSPLFATSLASLVILEGGTDPQREEILPKVTSGERILTLALAEPEVSNDPRFVSVGARPGDGGYVITGTKLFVPYAKVADQILVVARTEGAPGDEAGLTLFLVDGGAPGLRLTPLETIAPGRQYQADLDDVRVSSDRVLGVPNQGLPVLRSVLAKTSAIRCAEMLGGAEHQLEVTAEYTKEREQFDRPIGTFQAVQHRLADMFIDVQGARWTSYQALCRLSQGLAAGRELAIANAFTSDACMRVAFGAQQLHGGAGVDLDHDLHFYFRRAKALELSFGSAPIHLEALESEIGL
ncbi:MAG: acyl-CoA/acyl-ACP dehydrogenase [Deltaproteobacteria bacterium]|nr:acyl-CoA/acyl-ACP dehydrogenase [Deltaproteobacteria bacterium]